MIYFGSSQHPSSSPLPYPPNFVPSLLVFNVSVPTKYPWLCRLPQRVVCLPGGYTLHKDGFFLSLPWQLIIASRITASGRVVCSALLSTLVFALVWARKDFVYAIATARRSCV